MNNHLTVTIVGGGNSAHVLIPFLKRAGYKVNLMTRRPDDWQETVVCELTDMKNSLIKTFHGTIDLKSKDPSVVIPDADVIILCMPVHQYRDALDRIGPYINRTKEEVYVGTIYGQAGFNWMFHEMEKEYKYTNTICFAVGLIPWICRIIEYGAKVANYGGKQLNICAITPPDKFTKFNKIFLDEISLHPLGVGKFAQACSFISLTLSVDNQIIHPARCYGLWRRYGGNWKRNEQVPFFYKDFDEISAKTLEKLDAEYTIIKEAVRNHFPDRPFTYMLSYLGLERLSHSSRYVDIKSSLKYSKQLSLIKTPTITNEEGSQSLDVDCRFFTDDIPYGLLIAKWIAEKLDVATPFIDEIIQWAETLRGEHWIDDKGKLDLKYCLEHKYTSGIPPSYGIVSVENILD